jgi:hypothetical protein
MATIRSIMGGILRSTKRLRKDIARNNPKRRSIHDRKHPTWKKGDFPF